VASLGKILLAIPWKNSLLLLSWKKILPKPLLSDARCFSGLFSAVALVFVKHNDRCALCTDIKAFDTLCKNSYAPNSSSSSAKVLLSGSGLSRQIKPRQLTRSGKQKVLLHVVHRRNILSLMHTLTLPNKALIKTRRFTSILRSKDNIKNHPKLVGET